MSKYVVIGTAGHVDHGKTTLIKALTGVDTDRLKEEKERELSIDLGFAPFDLPSGQRAGVVDVPGHRRFMGNMLAGISGIDLVLLVIDLQEGVMPQTEEHLQVLNLLGIKKGLVVLTKNDLVEEEWIELMKEEVKETLLKSSFAQAPILTVSAVTGDGLNHLLELIDTMVDTVDDRETKGPFRIYIDRSFSLKGFGTVVTGTLKEGSITEGEMAELLPQRRKMRIRQIQVHGEKKVEAFAGQRVALNVPDLSTSQLGRGDVICTPQAFISVLMMDVWLQIIPNFPHSLKDNTRVHFHLGTSSVLARVSIHGQKELAPGERGYARFYFEEPVVGGYGDPFIIRFYSPLQTMGGGIVLDEDPWRGKRDHLLLDLKALHEEKDPYRILYVLKKKGLLSAVDLFNYLHPRPYQLEALLSKLLKGGKIVLLGRETYLLKEDYLDYREEVLRILNHYHTQYHLEEGMGKAALGEALSPRVKGSFQLFLDLLMQEGLLCIQGERVALASFSPKPTWKEEQLLRTIEDAFMDTLSPPNLKDLAMDHNLPLKDLMVLLGYLVRQKRLVKVQEDLFFHPEALEEMQEKTVVYLLKEGSIRANEFRDLMGTTRKYAIPLLEHLENQHVTRREGDIHILNQEAKKRSEKL